MGALTEQAPVLLEQTEVGGVVGLAVAVGIVSGVHILAGTFRVRIACLRIVLSYISSMAMARSRELPPASMIAFLRDPRPATVYCPRSARLSRETLREASGVGAASTPVAKMVARQGMKNFILDNCRKESVVKE